jgi:hypothetical protein
MMPLPRVRFTVRRMMIAVAVAGLVLGIVSERRHRFTLLARSHPVRMDILAVTNANGNADDQRPSAVVFSDGSRVPSNVYNWHYMLREKYEFAARYPWLPVWPDPPEPR